MKDKARSNSRVSRRRVLKGAAGLAGAAIGSGLVKGFPTIWAQNIKDVTLTHVGMSYSTIIDIARQATKDLGFKVEMAVTDHPGFVNRVTTQPDSVDIADGELWQALLVVPRGSYQAINVKKIKLWDKMTPIYTKGTFDGKQVSRIGISPIKVQYLASADAKSFAKEPTEWATFVPGFYNADTLGMRPDLIQDARSSTGASCSTQSSRARRQFRTSRQSASWTRPWRPKRTARSNTPTKAT